MTWEYTPYLIPLAMTAAIAVGLAGHAWRRRHVPGALPFALLMGGVGEYSLATALELAGDGIAEKLLAANLAYLGLAIIPPAWFAFALHYTGHAQQLRRLGVGLLAIIPLLTVGLVWTNDYHGLMRRAVTLNVAGPFPQLDVVRGVWYWPQAGYSYLLILVGTALLLREYRRARSGHRLQTASLLVGILAPLVSNLLYLGRLSPPPIDDLTPFAFTLTGVAFAWNLFRWRMLDTFVGLIPLAHDTIVAVMPDVVIVLDPEGRVIDLNPAAQHLIGRPARQVKGQPVDGVLAGWPSLPLASAGQTPVQTEISLQNGTGRRDYDLLVSPLRQGRGRPVGHLIVLREMTERTRAQEALQAAHEQVVGILESISDAFFALDATWHFTYVNRRAEELWGRPRAALIGQALWTELPGLVDASREATLRQAAAERRAITFETLSPLLDQWIALNVYPSATGLAIYMQDIGARKQAEGERELLLAREQAAHAQAEAATRVREEFLAIASHELRTPLTVLKGYAQLLSRQVAQPALDPIRMAGLAGQITRQLQRFETLVADLLDLSQLQDGRVVLRRADLDLAELARQVLANLDHLPERMTHHQITLEAPVPVMVNADADRLDQVLTNLISNAVKYSPHGGQICVSAQARGDQAEITVSDEGIGIPAAEQPTLFQPFTRTEGARRTGYGTGLGLYIAAQIVQHHGGTIGLTSTPGAGTTVTVRLPRPRPGPRAAGPGQAG